MCYLFWVILSVTGVHVMLMKVNELCKDGRRKGPLFLLCVN